MAEGGERRKSQRIRFETRVDLVYKGVNGFASVRTGNASAGGLFVMQAQPPAPGTRVDFGLMVGAKGLHRGTAEVMWVRPAETAAEHPAGFGMRFLSFREGSAELIAELVAETVAGAQEPTDHGEEAPATAATLATRTPTAPIEVPAEVGDRDSRSGSDRTTTVMRLDLPAEAAGEPAPPEPFQVEGAAGGSAPQPPSEPEAGESAAAATVMAPIAELAAGEAVTLAEPVSAEPGTAPQAPTVAEAEEPAGAATVVARVADLQAGTATAPHRVPEPPPPSNEVEPQATTMIDMRQAMAAMHEFRAEAAAGAEEKPAPTAPAPAVSTAPPVAPAPTPTPPEKADAKPAEREAKAGASPAPTPASESKPAPAPKATPAKAAGEPAAPPAAPAKPAPAPAKPAPTPAESKPAPAPEAKKEPAAPAKPAAKEKRTGPPVSKGLIRLAVLVLVAGAVYLVCTQTRWGRETTSVAQAWVKDALASARGKVTPSETEPVATSPVVLAPATRDAADQIVEVTWEGRGPTTLITVTANGPLADDRILHEELSRPPRSLVRVKGIRRPFSGFQERTDVPHLVGLRVGHHFELDPPELFVVAEPESGAKVTRVEVSGSTIQIEVTIPPTPMPKPKRGR